MEREQAIKILSGDTSLEAVNELKYYAGFCSDKVIEQIQEAMDMGAEALKKQSWIPCSERLPECEWGAETEALFYQTKAGYVRTGYFGRGGLLRDAYFRGYADITEGCDASDVVAWMPLPEPYKGVE